jgi:transcriptional regulator with PAS, ATPase and Fis domain
MKILLSWIAYSFDFDGNKISENSPTKNIHQYGDTRYDHHYILSTSSGEETRAEVLANDLNTHIKETEFIVRYLNIPNRAYHLSTVYNAISAFIKTLPSPAEIDVLYSNGTRAMSIAWFMYYSNGERPIKLIQGIAPEFNKESNKPKFIQVLVHDSFPGITTIKATDTKSTILHTETNSIARERAKRIAQYEGITCTIFGESGTGKENIAKTIHSASARSDKKYITVNCAALSDELLESRLFGHKKGAFTDAKADHTGFFEAANGGSIFLDEIGDISPKLQVSLLRVLQEGKIMKIGSNEEISVDVRVIAATNKDLKEAVRKGSFREDLYYRLTETSIQLMPLREYKNSEVELLIDHFFEENSLRFGKKLKIKKSVKQKLAAYSFPGNIREMKSIILNFFVFCDKEVSEHDLPNHLTQSTATYSLKKHCNQHILDTLNHFEGNLQRTARALGISNNTLKTRLKEIKEATA